MNNTNKFVSSDNVGYASILLEQEYNYNDLVGKGNFVGAFCSANLGDVSPNIMGPKCQVLVQRYFIVPLIIYIDYLSKSVLVHHVTLCLHLVLIRIYASLLGPVEIFLRAPK